jgi:hypothetical protein
MNDFKIHYPLDLGSTHLIILWGGLDINFDPDWDFFRQIVVLLIIWLLIKFEIKSQDFRIVWKKGRTEILRK